MTDPEHREEARRWLRYAYEDLTSAERMAGSHEAIPRHACLLAQQAVEKLLKAALIFLSINFPYSHDLDALRNLIPSGWRVREEHADLARLTEWAIAARYPGDWPDATQADAHAATQQARSVWTTVTADLARHGLDAGAPS